MISDKVFVFVALNGAYIPAGLLRTDGRSGFFFRYGDKFLERKDRLCLDPVTLCGYIFQGCRSKIVHDQNANHSGGFA